MLVKTSLTYRHGFVAPPGYVIISADFANQELRTTAYKSKDAVMMAAFTAPEELSNYFDIVETINGIDVITKKLITYANPALDLHSLTAKNCYSDAFINVPDYKIIDVASNTIRDGIAIRKAGKIVNFGLLIYGPLIK